MIDLLQSSVWLVLLIAAITLVGPVIAGLFLHRRRRQLSAARRSPLNTDLLRAPAHSLREEVEVVRNHIDELIIALLAGPLLLYSIHVTQSYVFGARENLARIVVTSAVAISIVAWALVRLRGLAQRHDRLRIAIDAEVAVGQQLDQLMRDGACVFHDVPAEGFNIDHVVVSAVGIFAVETKARTKPIRGRGKDDATVISDGATLRFPTHTDVSSVPQSVRQAAWLAKWLTSAVGSQVEAHPVLAIPGWFVEARVRGPAFVFNAKNPQWILKSKVANLSAELQQRVVHQLDQRCRTVKPRLAKQNTLTAALNQQTR